MSDPATRSTPTAWRRALLIAVGLGVVALAVGRAVWGPADPFPMPPLPASPFLNTRPGVGYVGSDTCRRCHEGRHASFRHTGMGRSMAEVDADREPPDA